MSKEIQVFDNVISLADNDTMYRKLLHECSFQYGEVDRKDTPPTGMVSELPKESQVRQFLEMKLHSIDPSLKDAVCDRSYVNLFFPHEKPFFHKDGPCRTCLFYINPQTEPDEGGETHFLVNAEIYGVLPVPGRLVIFNGNIVHRATSLRTIPRLTVAFKYLP